MKNSEEKNKKLVKYISDAWTYVHFFGSSNLFMILVIFFETKIAAIIAFMAGVLWECLDELYRMLDINYLDNIFDKRGFDIRDVITDFLGVSFGILILYYIKNGL